MSEAQEWFTNTTVTLTHKPCRTWSNHTTNYEKRVIIDKLMGALVARMSKINSPTFFNLDKSSRMVYISTVGFIIRILQKE